MARPTLPKALEALIAKLEPEMAEIVLDAFQSMRDGINVDALIEALERNDVEAALSALDITPADFNEYVLGRAQAYAAAGALEASFIPTDEANSVRFVFDMQNPRAEQWIRREAATRIEGYVQEQIATARQTIADGYMRGDGPKQIALDIAGRVERGSNRRTGGSVGLSDPQAGYVKSMRERLASGDPVEMKKVLGSFKDGKWIKGSGMTLRDKRFDAKIKRAIRDGKPVAQADIDEMAAKYADRLLKRRAEDIARTETAQSVFGARAESYRQALEREGLPDDALTKTWRHQGAIDENARAQHVAMNNKVVTGIDTPFVLPDNTLMQFAHDPAGGVKHNANCRCGTDFRILFGYQP